FVPLSFEVGIATPAVVHGVTVSKRTLFPSRTLFSLPLFEGQVIERLLTMAVNVPVLVSGIVTLFAAAVTGPAVTIDWPLAAEAPTCTVAVSLAVSVVVPLEAVKVAVLVTVEPLGVGVSRLEPTFGGELCCPAIVTLPNPLAPNAALLTITVYE